MPLAFLFWDIRELLRLLGQPAAILGESSAYVRAILWGTPAYFLFFAFRQPLQAMQVVRPAAIAIVAAFTHTQRGADPVVAFFRGFLPALASFGLFCVVLALALEPLGLWTSLALALVVQLSVQTATLWIRT